MLKNSLIKVIIFINYLLCFIPWIARIFVPGFGYQWFAAVVVCWILITGLAQWLNSYLAQKAGWMKTMVILLSLGSSWLLAVLLISPPNMLMRIFLALLSMIVWIAGMAVSSVDRASNMVGGRYLIIGLILLSVNPLVFHGSPVLAYICFILYLLTSAFLVLYTSHRNKIIPGAIITAIFIIGLGFGSIREWIVKGIWMFYRYIIVNVLLLILTPLAYVVGGAATKVKVNQWIEPPEIVKNPPENQFSGMKELTTGDTSEMNWWPLIKTALIVLLFITLGIVIYRLIKRYTIHQEEDELERKESVLSEINLSEMALEKGKRVLNRIRQTLYTSTPEGKVRKMFRDTVTRMTQQSLPISKATTPNEAMRIAKEEENALFHTYNKVRYHENKITPEELSQAEEGFQRIQKKL